MHLHSITSFYAISQCQVEMVKVSGECVVVCHLEGISRVSRMSRAGFLTLLLGLGLIYLIMTVGPAVIACLFFYLFGLFARSVFQRR